MEQQAEKLRPGQLLCLAVDDEPIVVSHLADLINQHPDLYLGLATTDPYEAKAYEQENRVDIAFVDIEMEEMDGLVLIKGFNFHTWVVICTAHGELGDDSSLAGAAGFIRKPIQPARFEIEVGQIRRRMVALVDTQNSTREYFHPETRQAGQHKIALEEIVFFHSDNEKVYLVQVDGTVVEANRTLADLSQDLDCKGFLRIHRSYLANMYFKPIYVPKSKPYLRFGREVRFKLPGNPPNTLPIGRHFRQDVLNSVHDATR